jgi:multidrug efflux pump subunit AcrA (membrane-fusion protein)
MSNAVVRDLADCSEFRQTLLARPPALVHGTAILLIGLLGTALVWLALTQADLVVRAPGHVRPVTTPYRVIAGANGDTLSATSGGRVVAVHFREGDEVSAGQVLAELDASQLDSEIAKSKRALQAGEEELAQLRHQEVLLEGLRLVATGKAEAELEQARERVRQAQLRRGHDIELAELERDEAKDDRARMSKARAGFSEGELVKADLKLRQAEAKLEKARLPVEHGEVRVAEQALALVAKDYESRRNELVTKRGARSGEVDAARIQLAKLEREREQAVIRAPVGGLVTKADVKAGDILERGKPVAEIAEQRGFLFEASVPNEEVGRLQVGLPARVKVDAFDYQKYGTLGGTVRYVAPDAAVQDGQRAATYLVRIEVSGDEVGRGDLRGRVKLGMSGQTEVVTGRESLLSLLVRKIRQSISLG